MPKLHTIAKDRIHNDIDQDSLANCFSAAGTGDDDDQQNPFSWRLFELFGAMPAPLDRHVAEYFPALFSRENSYYGKTLGVDAYSFEGTILLGDRTFDETLRHAFLSDPLPDDYFEQMNGEHEQVCDIVESIRHDGRKIFFANLPNCGRVSNLPENAILESPAMADGGGMHPIVQPPLTASVAATLASRLLWVETVVEAALEGSREKFVQALLIDGAVTSTDMAYRLADDLLQAQAEYLPQFFREMHDCRIDQTPHEIKSPVVLSNVALRQHA
jgi:alpha-galactosidase